MHALNKNNRSIPSVNLHSSVRDRSKAPMPPNNDGDDGDGDSKKTTAAQSKKLVVPTEKPKLNMRLQK